MVTNVITDAYAKLSLEEERRLISEAQKGFKKSKEELVLRHLKFLKHRIRKIVFPSLHHNFKDDLLTEGILIIYQKIGSYDLDYKDVYGNPNPVKFTSYIWKRIDGYILDFLKKELMESNPNAHFIKSKGKLGLKPGSKNPV